MGSPHLPKLTSSLLLSYSEAVLCNADELLAESLLLRDHDHMARAYFIAVSCIEETGKALLAFDAQLRNLSDPAVCKKLKTSMESHSVKIGAALSMWALSCLDQRKALETALDLMFQLNRGREPSMYTDLRTDPGQHPVQTPRDIVRPSAARDCVRLAENCNAYAHFHIRDRQPTKFTTAQNKVFTMRSAKFEKLLKNEDFWWYYLSQMETGQPDMAEAVLGYERYHAQIGKPFRTER